MKDNEKNKHDQHVGVQSNHPTNGIDKNKNAILDDNILKKNKTKNSEEDEDLIAEETEVAGNKELAKGHSKNAGLQDKVDRTAKDNTNKGKA